MAIKIDLLPGYVGLTKVFRRVVTLSLLSLGLLLAGLTLVYRSKQLELQTAQQNREVAVALAAQTTTAENATSAANSARAGYDAANNFMLASSKTGSERSALVNLIRQYIYENSVVRSIDVTDGKNVTIVATVTTPDEYVTFRHRLVDATGVLFAPTPRVSGVGGFANGATPLVVPQPEAGTAPVVVNYPITLTAQAVLLNPVQVPADPVNGAAPAAAGVTGGAPPGALSPGGPPSGAPPAPPR